MTAWVELSKRAKKDLDRLDIVSGRRVIASIDRLNPSPSPANLDVRPLVGHAPWRRLRVGEFRVLFRSLTAAEIRERGVEGTAYLVDRIVDRRDLEDAIRSL